MLSQIEESMASIQAVFWDYDNTILATVDAHWSKHKIVLAQQGIYLDERYRQRIYENNSNQNWEWMRMELGLQLPKEDYLQAVDYEFQKHLFTLEIRPGVTQLLERINSMNIPQAIITNARRSSAEPVLQNRNITSFMQFVLCSEDSAKRKPDPDPYLKGIETMSRMIGFPLDPKLCIAIEDDPKGVESAKKAGAIVIHRKLKEDDRPSPLADYVCFHEEEFVTIVNSLLRI